MNKTAYLWTTFLIQASIFVSAALSLQQIFVNVDIESFVENLEAIGIFVLVL